MKGKIYKNIRVFDPENDGKELIFRDLAELFEILQAWILNDDVIVAAFGTKDIKYVMSKDEIAEHLVRGNQGEKFIMVGKKHQRAKILLAHLSRMG